MRARYALPVVVAFGLVIIAGAAFAQGETGDPTRGGQLFVDNCAVCHGVDGQGRVGASLKSFPGIEVSATIRQTISQGVPGSVMPSWGEANGGPLSDQDIADLPASGHSASSEYRWRPFRRSRCLPGQLCGLSWG